MSRVIQDPDVPRHRGQRVPRRWKVEVVWRTRIITWGLVSDGWCWSGKYADARGAQAGFERRQRDRYYTAARVLDPDGNVVAEWHKT